MFGESWNLEEGLLQNLEEFVCAIHGGQFKNINDLRYKIYCSKRGKISCEDLPSCISNLIEHCKVANYKLRIWRLALEPVGSGWEMLLDEFKADSLDMKWMSCKSAPDEVNRIKIYTKRNPFLQFISFISCFFDRHF